MTETSARGLLWVGLALFVAGAALVVVLLVRGPGKAKKGEAAAGEVLPVAPLPAPVPLTTPVPGQLRGIPGRYFRLVGSAGAPLTLPDPKRTQVIVDMFDAAGGLIPQRERVILSPSPESFAPPGLGLPPNAEVGAPSGAKELGAVAWIAVDLRRVRNVTRISFASMDARMSENSSRAFLQILDTDMDPICSLRFGDVASQRLIFDLEGVAAQTCAEAQKLREERAFAELFET